MRYFKNRYSDYHSGDEVKIDFDHWKRIIMKTISEINKHSPPSKRHCDGGLYVGCAGIGYALHYISRSEVMKNTSQDLLRLSMDYISTSLSDLHKSSDSATSFLLGGAGLYVVASDVYDSFGESGLASKMRDTFNKLSPNFSKVDFLQTGSDELFVGRAGYLCGAYYLNNYYKTEIVSIDQIVSLCKVMVQSGHKYSKKHNSSLPLMYAYYDTEYLGAAHGLSSILLMLLNCPQFLHSDTHSNKLIKDSIDGFLQLRQDDGNFPPAMDDIARPRRAEDELVHWCHGAPGVVYLLAKAYLVYREDKYLDACKVSAELTWQNGLLKKGPGICHGVAGNGYVFLLLYRLTNDRKYLHRALMFAEFMQTEEFKSGARTPDSPWSLYEGLSGTICFLTDLMQPKIAEFPFFDVFN